MVVVYVTVSVTLRIPHSLVLTTVLVTLRFVLPADTGMCSKWPCHDTLLRTAPESVTIASFCNIVRCSPELIVGYALCDGVGTGAGFPKLHTSASPASI